MDARYVEYTSVQVEFQAKLIKQERARKAYLDHAIWTPSAGVPPRFHIGHK